MKKIVLLLMGIIGVNGLIGCSYNVSGLLTTTNGKPLLLKNSSENIILHPGVAQLELSKRPLFFGDFTLTTAQENFSVTVAPMEYGAHSIRLEKAKTGFDYTIDISWSELPGASHTERGGESCVGDGYCTKYTTKEVCTTDSKGANKCEQQSTSDSGHFYDCPGTRPMEYTYQAYFDEFVVRFMDENQEVAATFQGEADGSTSKVREESVGGCVI